MYGINITSMIEFLPGHLYLLEGILVSRVHGYYNVFFFVSMLFRKSSSLGSHLLIIYILLASQAKTINKANLYQTVQSCCTPPEWPHGLQHRDGQVSAQGPRGPTPWGMLC